MRQGGCLARAARGRGIPVASLALLIAAGCVSSGPATPAESAAAVSATPLAATPTAAAFTSLDSFGYLVGVQGGGYALRTERDPSTLATIDGGAELAISPDGRKVAYWALRTGGHTWTLRIFDAATPSIAPRSVLSYGAPTSPPRPVWSGDGAALVFASRISLGPASIRTKIQTFDLAAGLIREVATFSDGEAWPVAWARSAGVIGILRCRGCANGPESYVSLGEDGRVTEDRFAGGPVGGDQIDVDRDGSRLLLVHGDLRIWRTESFASLTELAAPVGSTFRAAVFRPGTDEVFVVLESAGQESIEVWRRTGQRRSLLTQPKSPADTFGAMALARPDGSAVAVITSDVVRVVDAQTGAFAKIDLRGARLRAWIALPSGQGTPAPSSEILWLRYRNDRLGIEFDYPESVAGKELATCAPTENDLSMYVGERIWIQTPAGAGALGTTVDDFVRGLENVTRMTGSIDGQPAIFVTYRFSFGRYGEATFVAHRDRVYRLDFTAGVFTCEPMPGVSEFAVYRRVVSTLHFLD